MTEDGAGAAPRVVLVTGVARHLGLRTATALAAQPGVRRVVGVDVQPPADSGRDAGITFVRADIRNPILVDLLATEHVDTVVHLSLLSAPRGAGGRPTMKEVNVIGTMQLLAACQRASGVNALVVRSTTAVYGSSSHDPALFSEDTEPQALPRSGFAKDAVEIEGYVRGFSRRRPDVAVTVLRFANLVGPAVDSGLTEYFSLPVVPTVLGFDPRLQFLHEDDAVAVLSRAVTDPHPGVYNVAGEGVLLLSQALRRAGRLSVAVPGAAVPVVGELFRRIAAADFTPEQLHVLAHGRAVDTSRLEQRFGFRPTFTSTAAFDDFVQTRVRRLYDDRLAEALERRARSGLAALAGLGEP